MPQSPRRAPERRADERTHRRGPAAARIVQRRLVRNQPQDRLRRLLADIVTKPHDMARPGAGERKSGPPASAPAMRRAALGRCRTARRSSPTQCSAAHRSSRCRPSLGCPVGVSAIELCLEGVRTRDWCNGSTVAFQASSRGSSPLSRSTRKFVSPVEAGFRASRGRCRLPGPGAVAYRRASF